MEEYNLWDLELNGFVYMDVMKRMNGIPQAWQLANLLLKERLLPHVFYECNHTPGLWQHATSKLTSTLWVEEFGINYTRREDVEMLIAILKNGMKFRMVWQEQHIVASPLPGIMEISKPQDGWIWRCLTISINYCTSSSIKNQDVHKMHTSVTTTTIRNSITATGTHQKFDQVTSGGTNTSPENSGLPNFLCKSSRKKIERTPQNCETNSITTWSHEKMDQSVA